MSSHFSEQGLEIFMQLEKQNHHENLLQLPSVSRSLGQSVLPKIIQEIQHYPKLLKDKKQKCSSAQEPKRIDTAYRAPERGYRKINSKTPTQHSRFFQKIFPNFGTPEASKRKMKRRTISQTPRTPLPKRPKTNELGFRKNLKDVLIERNTWSPTMIKKEPLWQQRKLMAKTHYRAQSVENSQIHSPIPIDLLEISNMQMPHHPLRPDLTEADRGDSPVCGFSPLTANESREDILSSGSNLGQDHPVEEPTSPTIPLQKVQSVSSLQSVTSSQEKITYDTNIESLLSDLANLHGDSSEQIVIQSKDTLKSRDPEEDLEQIIEEQSSLEISESEAVMTFVERPVETPKPLHSFFIPTPSPEPAKNQTWPSSMIKGYMRPLQKPRTTPSRKNMPTAQVQLPNVSNVHIGEVQSFACLADHPVPDVNKISLTGAGGFTVKRNRRIARTRLFGNIDQMPEVVGSPMINRINLSNLS